MPTHTMGRGWTALDSPCSRGDPLHSPATGTPQTQHRHHHQSLMGAARATSVTPQHTTRSPLPKTAHRKRVGEREAPSPPRAHRGTAKAHSRALAPLLGGHGGLGGPGHGGVRAGLSAPAKMLGGKAPKNPRGEEGTPPAPRASRLWGGDGAGGTGSGKGAAGCQLGPDWEPRSSRAVEDAQGEGAAPRCGEAGGTGDTSPRCQKGLCGAAALRGSVPERGRGGPLPFHP